VQAHLTRKSTQAQTQTLAQTDTDTERDAATATAIVTATAVAIATAIDTDTNSHTPSFNYTLHAPAWGMALGGSFLPEKPGAYMEAPLRAKQMQKMCTF
jgi:hypothetical protein